MSTVAANCALLCVDDVGAGIRVTADDGSRSVKVLDVDRITRLELGGLLNCMPPVEIVPLIVSVSLLLLKEQGKMGVANLSLLQGRQFGFQLSAHQELAWCKTVLKRCSTVQEKCNVWVS